MIYSTVTKKIKNIVKVIFFSLLLTMPGMVWAQNTHENELNALWNQADFWETAGNVDKMFEYKLKLVDLYRRYRKEKLPTMLRNIAVSFDRLPAPYYQQADKYFQEALTLMGQQEQNDSTISSYYDCLFDYIAEDFKRKNFVSIYKKIDNYIPYLLTPNSVTQKEKKKNALNIKYNAVSLINDSCKVLYDQEQYLLAESLMRSYAHNLYDYLNSKVYDPEISNLCLSSAWRYADILWKLNKKKESIEWMHLHNDFLRRNLALYDKEDHYYKKYLWAMERYLANRYYVLGNNEKDIEISLRILSEARSFYDSDILANKLIDLAISYDRCHTRDENAKAQQYSLEAINILSSLPKDEKRTKTLLSEIDHLAGMYCLASQYQDGIDLIKRFDFLLKESDAEKYDPEVFNILGWLSSCYHHMDYSIEGSREEAKSINEKVLDYKEKCFGEHSKEYLVQLRLNTFPYQEQDSLIKKMLFYKGYSLWQSIPQKEEMYEYASFVGSYLTFLYSHNMGNYSSLEEFMDKICTNENTEFHIRINYYKNRSDKEIAQLNEKVALDYCNKAIKICEQYVERPEIKERLAQMLCQKAFITYSSGDYALTKECAYKASIIIEEIENENLLKADIMEVLSYFFQLYGETNKADEFAAEASNIRIKCLGKEVSLPVIDKAIRLLTPEHQISFLTNKFIDGYRSSPEIVSLIITKAQAYYNLEEYDLCEKTLEIAEVLLNQHKDSFLFERGKKYIFDHTRGQIVYTKASLNYKRKDIDKAISYMKEYRLLTQSDNELLLFLNTLYALKNDYYNLKQETEFSLNYLKKHILEKFLYLSDSERDIYMTNQVTRVIREIESYAFLCPGNGDVCKNAYEAVLLEKGLALNSAYRLQKELKNSKVNLNMLSQLKRQLEFAKDNETRERIQLRISLEEQSLQKLPFIGDYKRELFTSIENIKKELNISSIVVEFIKYNNLKLNTGKKQYRFGALLLKKDCSFPFFIDLCSEDELCNEKDKGVNVYRDDSQIYKLILEPLKDYFQNVQDIYFSPVDLLCTINLEIIAEDHFGGKRFYRISSSRELCKKKAKPNSRNVSLFGGLCYDCSTNHSPAKAGNQNYLEYLLNDTITRNGITYLPGSKTEVETIYKISKEKGWKALLYTDNYGTERDYKKLQGTDISVLHLSTHGFTLGHSTVKDFNEPMRRCGLLLTGAQPAWNGEKCNSDEDGILLGEEIANVPIENNDIVILSACETGLGELTPDGVWGLQRAFKKAGANSVLMSLWKVDDFSTQLFMEEFYRNYFSGKNKSLSLKIARNFIKNYIGEDGTKLFEDPYYWAGFIMLD